MKYWPSYDVNDLGTSYEVTVDLEESILLKIEQDGEDVWDSLDQADRDRLCEMALQEAREQAEETWVQNRLLDDDYNGC
tara:strand:- start:1649 stop:1885 length:237 start_codon:yes stop_codon:yes gene_type:complete